MDFRKKFVAVPVAACVLGVSWAIAEKSLTQIERDQEQAKILKQVTEQVLSRLETYNTQRPALRADLGEHLIKDEDAAIQSATDAVIRTVMNRAFSGSTPGVVKGDHGKTLACLTGTISFHDDVPESLRRGVVVPGKTFSVEARLSNAEEPGRNDRSSLSQGVALKLKNLSSVIGSAPRRLPDFPETNEQDFLMTSSPIFFLSNIVEYNVAFGLRAGGGKMSQSLGTILTTPNLWPRIGEELSAKIRSSFAKAPGKPKNIFTHPYWSKHPYAWGEASQDLTSIAVKYGVAPIPCQKNEKLTESSSAENYQQDFIREAFQKNDEICFAFRVQARPADATEQTYPIEDGNVEWKEDKAPFINIAKVSFKASENAGWDSQRAQAACGKTEFSPWNGLYAHQPLSNLARGRRDVYKASALVRELKDQLDAQVAKVVDLPKPSPLTRLNPVNLLRSKRSSAPAR